MCRAHCAVIFAIAQLSCLDVSDYATIYKGHVTREATTLSRFYFYPRHAFFSDFLGLFVHFGEIIHVHPCVTYIESPTRIAYLLCNF